MLEPLRTRAQARAAIVGGDPEAAAGVAGHGRAADRRRHRRRARQRSGARRGRHRRVDRHLRPTRRPVAAAERLLPISPARRRRRGLARAGRRYGRGERGAGRRSVGSRGRNSHGRRCLRDRSGRRGELPPARRRARGARPIRVGRCHTDGTGRPARRTGAGPSAGRASQGQHGSAAAAATTRCRRHTRAGLRWDVARQRDLDAIGRGVFAGSRADAAGSAALRDLLPLAGRPQHPVLRAARIGRAHVDGVRSAHSAHGVRRRA